MKTHTVTYLLTFFVLGGMALATAPICTDLPLPAVPDAPASGVAMLTTSDFSTGFFSVVDLESRRAYNDLFAVHPDADVSSAEGFFFVLNRLGADNIRRFEPFEDYRTVYERTTGEQSNPQDIVVIDNTTAVVSLYRRNYLAVFNPVTGKKTGQVDLSKWADDDGLAEVADLHRYNNTLYAAVQRLDRNQSGASIWPPVGISYLIKISLPGLIVEEALPLPFSNPLSKIHRRSGSSRLVMACPGRFSSSYSLDGGIVIYDTATGDFIDSPMTEQQAGLEISDAVMIDETRGFFIGSDDQFNTSLYSFSAGDVSSLRRLVFHSFEVGGNLQALEVDSQGRLYLLDRDSKNPGLRIFDGSSGQELTAQPISTGLPPLAIELVE